MSSKQVNLEPKEFKVDLKSLEVEIEKYPMAESKNMFESFLIIGYDELYFQEKILKGAIEICSQKNETNSKDKKKQEEFKKLFCRNLPTILNSITSDFTGPILNGNQIIENVFPIPPMIIVDDDEIKDKDKDKDKDKSTSIEKKNYFVIFSNIQNNVVNYGYGQIFYEKKIHEKIKIYIPKAFVIISQYPFYNIFNKLCDEIKELFINPHLQIPIEIQIYNIINFVPASIDTGMKMTLIPKQELYQINQMKTQDDFFFFEKQVKYYPEQLNGYRSTEINFCYLLNVIPIDLIIEIYLNLICGRVIGFFVDNITELSIILHIFHQFLFPFAPNENVSCLPPIKFFCNDTVDQSIVGFLCNYDDLEKYDPFRQIKKGEHRCLTDEDENIDLDPLYFRCDYILDLNKRILKEPDKYSTNDNSKVNKKLNDYIKKLLGKFSKKNPDTEFEKILFKLLISLKDNLYKLTSFRKMKKKIFHPFVREDTQYMNHFILESFYQFNLGLAFIYYERVSKDKGDYRKTKEEQINTPLKSQKESGLSPDEYLFFTYFGNSLYGNCLDNFVGGYSTREPTIYKAPKLIFENLIYFMKMKKMYDLKDKRMPDILDIYDELYTNKIKDINDEDENNKKDNGKKNSNIYEATSAQEFTDEEIAKAEKIKNINHKTFTFLEFYKYYVSNPDIALYFYNIANPEFVSGKIIKNNIQNIKYVFRYKKIALDQNMIFKYIYKVKQMDEKTREKCFKNIIQKELIDKEQIKQIKSIKSYENFISAALEKYYIENKLIDNMELINFSILGLVILTVSKHTLFYFPLEIGEVINNLIFLTRKFSEILLSVALRVFMQEKDKKYYIYEKYFYIYKVAIENKNIFPNDQLINIKKSIDRFTNLFENEKVENLSNIKEEMEKIKNKKYELSYNKSFLKKYNVLELTQDIILNEKEKKKKLDLKFSCDKIKKLDYPLIYPIQKIYDKICYFIDNYYKNLDYDFIKKDKDEFNKLIIYLLFYVTILKEKKDKKDARGFPKDIESFLISCLEY